MKSSFQKHDAKENITDFPLPSGKFSYGLIVLGVTAVLMIRITGFTAPAGTLKMIASCSLVIAFICLAISSEKTGDELLNLIRLKAMRTVSITILFLGVFFALTGFAPPQISGLEAVAGILLIYGVSTIIQKA